ncbi:MAG TPA: hypothetical protein VHX38_18810 [Pseudonocardiaceae bacterium]|jgi:hypothetical protein|nr:hypothetical protein [Pseudonocardiaceae bacterium]
MERTVYELPFDGTEFEGLSIRVKAMTMGQRLNTFFDLAPTEGESAEARKEKNDQRLDMFIDHVIEWNVEDEHGEPVPISLDGLYKVAEPQQVGVIMGVWASGRMSVPAPLERPSPATRLSEIPMTVQESTPVPA